MDNLKLRGSWGSVGNQAVGEYDYMPMMGSYRANWLLDGTQQTTLNPPSMASQNYTWEKVETLDFGLEISALQNRLSASVGWYQRDTKGMLTKGADFPGVVGTESPKQNAADLRTKGWELSASWRETRGEWNYSAGFNLYDSKSVITKFANETGLLDGYREGKVLGEIWGYQTDGYYSIDDFKQTTDGVKGWQDNVWNLNEGVTSIKGTNVRPGDIKFKNLNDWGSSKNMIDAGENTESNPGDRKVIGNTTFRFQYGITASVGWKGFDLSVLLQGVGKRDIYTNDPLRFSFGQGTFSTIYDSQLDYWKPISTDVK
ncbi:MAG: SusC/RagA family protein, partial [Rikenellaceae bacterium]